MERISLLVGKFEKTKRKKIKETLPKLVQQLVGFGNDANIMALISVISGAMITANIIMTIREII